MKWTSVGQGVFWGGYTQKVAAFCKELSKIFLPNRNVTAEEHEESFTRCKESRGVCFEVNRHIGNY